jgi:hypothetical protein
VPEIVLNQARVTALVGERIPAGVPQHVRMDVHAQARALSDDCDQVVHGLPCHWSALRQEPAVRTHLDAEEHTRRDYYQFKRNYRKLSLLLAEAPTPPEPAQAQSLLSLLASHPAVGPTSITARQLAHDFARYPIFTLSEYLDARYLAELEDAGWTCPFWLARFHDSLRIRHLESTAEAEDSQKHIPEGSFRRGDS